VLEKLFDQTVRRAFVRGLISRHVSVDGTPVRANASFKSFVPIEVALDPQECKQRRGSADEEDSGPPQDPGNPTVDFRGEKRSNRILVGVGVETTQGCTSEEQGCRELLRRARRRYRFKPKSLGADRGSFHQGFIEQLPEQRIQPHIAVELRGKTSTHSRMRKRQRGVGYQRSQRCRKKIEELFGEAKDWHGLRRFRRRRLCRVREETWLIGWVLNLKTPGEANPTDTGNCIG
jgi:hypothetical protein